MKRIGDYRVLKELGRSGATVVYHVEDSDRRQYTLKILLISEEKDVKIIQREAQVCKRFRHPSIVYVIGYKYLDPYHCLIMDYFDGEDLGKYIEKKKRLTIKDTVEIAWQICDALVYTHTCGVIHRDIKPQNIILGRGNKVKVTDFGLAKIASSTVATVADIVGVSAKSLLGTPCYLSPEQAKGEKADERSDLYSLGVVMYQMLTGKVPFDADNLSVILEMIGKKPPEPISAFQPRVPRDLETLVEKAMAKSPSHRFRSAEEMCTALQEIAEQEGIDLTIPSPISPWVKLRQMLLYWPFDRCRELVTDVGANIIWVLLSAIFVLMIGFFSAQKWNVERQPTSPDATKTPLTTATSNRTPTNIPELTFPTSTLTPTFTPTRTSSPTTTSTRTRPPTYTPTPIRVVSPTPEPAKASTPTLISPPQLTAPVYGVYREPITFRWLGIAGTSYQVTLHNTDYGYVHTSNWIQGFEWTFNIPGEQYGNWEFYVTSATGAKSDTWTFVFDPFMPPPKYPIGDINQDCIVDQADLILLCRAYGSKPGSPNWNPRADLDGDGDVDIVDQSKWAQHFGETCP